MAVKTTEGEAMPENKGIIHAMLLDSLTGKFVPVEIKLKFKIKARANLSGNIYYFDSAEYSNIEIESVKIFIINLCYKTYSIR